MSASAVFLQHFLGLFFGFGGRHRDQGDGQVLVFKRPNPFRELEIPDVDRIADIQP